MTEFQATTTPIPTRIKKIRIVVTSEYDEDDELIKSFQARAEVEDQDGEVQWEYQSTHVKLIELELISQQQKDQIISFIDTFRASVETFLLP